MNTPTTPCAKCNGTGTVTRFLDFHGGVCFDCGGDGVAKRAPRTNTRTVTGKARTQADLALETGEGTAEALAAMQTFRQGWREADYLRARALHAQLAAQR